MTKILLGVAAVLAVLSATGCCLPLHGGRHGYYSEGWSDGSRPRPPPPSRSWRDHRGD